MQAGYSWTAAWLSVSRQALILRRRQTQQSSSVEKGATSSPHTTHLPGFLDRAGWASATTRAGAGFRGLADFLVAI
jgi:hypothetical protein